MSGVAGPDSEGRPSMVRKEGGDEGSETVMVRRQALFLRLNLFPQQNKKCGGECLGGSVG